MPHDVDQTTVHYFMSSLGSASTSKAAEILAKFCNEDFGPLRSVEPAFRLVPTEAVYRRLQKNVIRYYDALKSLL